MSPDENGFDRARSLARRLVECQQQAVLAKSQYVEALHQLQAEGAPLADIRSELWDIEELSPVFHTNPWEPEMLAGFSPAAVIDVGAAGVGIDVLHQAFPDVHNVFIEPLQEFEEDLQQLVRNQGGEYHLIAVGSKEGHRTLRVDHQLLEKSSFHERTANWVVGEPPEAREVRLTTLDRLAGVSSLD